LTYTKYEGNTPFLGHFKDWGKGTGSTKGYVKNTTLVAFQTLYVTPNP
jgi:hypothetical protein